MSRPTNDETKGTRQVRVNEDLGEMISWILEVEGGTSARLLDPLIRASIEARYARHEAAISELKAAKTELERVKAKVKQDVSSGTPKPRRRPGG